MSGTLIVAALDSGVSPLDFSACSILLLSIVGSGYEEKDEFRLKTIKH